jgi:RNA polymerase sigma-70 factor (ECF subfamily)
MRPDAASAEEFERAMERAADPGAARGAPDPFLRQAIERCREQLPRKPALALEQRLESGGGEPDAVLANRVGMRLNTFLQNFTRARRFLLDCLRARGVDLEAELP